MTTRSLADAEECYAQYVDQASNLVGARCHGEDVTLFYGGEPIREHYGIITRQQMQADNGMLELPE